MESLSDAVQLEEMIREHRDALTGFVRRRVGNWPAALPDVDDVLQELYLRAKDKWRAFQDSHDITPRVRLFRLARDVISEIWERAGAQKRGLGRVQAIASDSQQCEAEQLAESFSSVGSRIARKELAQFATAMLTELKPAYREVLSLRYLDGMSLDEVARFLEIPLDTVRTRDFRATVKLRTLMTERFPNQSFLL